LKGVVRGDKLKGNRSQQRRGRREQGGGERLSGGTGVGGERGKMRQEWGSKGGLSPKGGSKIFKEKRKVLWGEQGSMVL